MAIDLSSLEGFDTPLPSPAAKAPTEDKPSGKPLEILLIDIEEDPSSRARNSIRRRWRK